MSSHFYNEQLYPLQDKVMGLMGSIESPFYLTGGTLLSRYILHHRYSDDLDFFANAIPDFHEQVDKIMEGVKREIPNVELSNKQDSYVRFYVYEGETILKIEFVNDVKYTVGQKGNAPSGIKLDTWQNVLSNKVTALSRLAAKDYVDILFLSFRYAFNWEYIIDEAKRKDASVYEIEVSQYFFNFNLTKLNEVNFPDTFAPGLITAPYFQTLARESLHGFDNSLCGQTLH
jgi:hypothetical protein